MDVNQDEATDLQRLMQGFVEQITGMVNTLTETVAGVKDDVAGLKHDVAEVSDELKELRVRIAVLEGSYSFPQPLENSPAAVSKSVNDASAGQDVCAAKEPLNINIENLNSTSVECMLEQETVVCTEDKEMTEKSSEIHNEDSEYAEKEALIAVIDSQVTPLGETLIEELRHPEFLSEKSKSTQQNDSKDAGCSVVKTVKVISVNQLSVENHTVNDDIDGDTIVMSTHQSALPSKAVVTPLSYLLVMPGRVMGKHLTLLSHLEVVNLLYTKMMFEEPCLCFKELVQRDEHGPGPPFVTSVNLFQF